MTTPHYWHDACVHLRNCDAPMKSLIDTYQGMKLISHGDAFGTLVRSIVGQQISVQAAQSVMCRLTEELPVITPDAVLAKSDDALRECGLSRAKVRYFQEIATYCQNPPDWHNTPPEQLKKSLLEVPGVGEWTWQMFAIFYLHLPDEFPLKDLGLRKALVKNYHLPSTDAIMTSTMQARIRSWSPWRTVAVWYLWRSIDPQPVSY